MNTQEKLKELYAYLEELERYSNAAALVDFDLMTISPKKAYAYQSETANLIRNLAFNITKKPENVNLIKALYASREDLHLYDQRLVDKLYENLVNLENVSPELYAKALKAKSNAYSAWIKARENSDYQIFAPFLANNVAIEKELLDLRPSKKATYYDAMIADFEEGFSITEYDAFFEALKNRLIPLLKKVQTLKKEIRTDFLFRTISLDKQEKFSHYIMNLIGFDSECGCLSTSEHPFTGTMSRFDTRITTHYYENNFISNLYSIIHEGGHAIFSQNEPDEIYDHHLQNHMTMAMHESVSRFYENRLGRSPEFIHFLYPQLQQFFREELFDISEEQLYLAVNAVTFNPIRTESDELGYCLHIVIRYELEKKFINDPNFNFANLNLEWNKLYCQYLGLDPKSDREGILQDIHWTDSYGYFPTYALGNAYNAMYLNEMMKKIPVFDLIAKGDFHPVKEWMKERVFKKASLLPPQLWIKEITGRTLDPQDFIEYLENKYETIYNK